MKPWVVIAGGGTAGHLVPGLVVAKELCARGVDADSIHFVGSDRGVEARMVPAAGFRLSTLPGRGLERRLSLQNVRTLFALFQGFVRAFGLLRRERPSVVLTLGGFAAAPCGAAAVLLRIPLVVAEQNARAGLVNRITGRFAKACAVPFVDTDLPHAVVTGNPVRHEVQAAVSIPREDAAIAIGLDPQRTILVVFTGSLGARSVNETVVEFVNENRLRTDIAVHHVVGRRDFDALAEPESLPMQQRTDAIRCWGDSDSITYQRVPYEDRMGMVLAAADVAVTRAGGSTVAELSVVGVPAIMVPLPIATRNHQEFNAAELVTSGGGVLIRDRELSVESLSHALIPILDSAEVRASMRQASRSVGHVDAAPRVADLLERYAAK